MKALLIYRAAQFSPNSVEKDKMILEAVGEELWNKGHDVTYVAEENISDDDDADVIDVKEEIVEDPAVTKDKADTELK